MMNFGFGAMGYGFVFWLLMLVILLAVVGWLVSGSAQRSGSRQTGEDAALEALRLRFARGEIDEEEYKRRRQLLEGEE